MKQIQFILCFLLVGSFTTWSQGFGGFPPSTRWKQLNSDTARIIFTKGAEEQASRIASLIHTMAGDTGLGINKRLRKVNVVLQSRSTIANAYVALAPFRSEFYMIPNSNSYEFGNLPWHENLAIHEYRHVQQYNNFKNGLSKGFFYLFGEQGQAFANAITIPDWFFEGDAVHAETALTGQGRGRLPYFLSGYNSLWLEGKNYSWLKLRNGSFKDYVPDHYQLGYLLANYGYLKYGPQFWENVTRDASKFRGLFYPFQKAIKRYAGVDYKTFRNEALNFYKERLGGGKTQAVVNTKTVTNILYPQHITEDSVLYLKTAYNKINAFYIRDKKGEHRLQQQHITAEDWFSYRNGQLAYTAYSTHPRWNLINYNDIVLMNVRTGAEKRITSKQKYYTPDLSHSGNRIVTVRINDSLQTELHLLDAKDGSVVKKIAPVNNYYYLYPRFVEEDKIVIVARTPNSQVSLQLLDLTTEQWEEILPPSSNTISTPFVTGHTVYFSSNIHGNDDLYAVRLKDKALFQITQGKTGNYFPAVYNNTLAWSQFTSEGLQVSTEEIQTSSWSRINVLNWQEQAAMYPVALENNILQPTTRRFAEKRYSQATGLFNFHSWSPDYVDPEFTFSLYSDNILGSFSNVLFYRYNQNESSHGLGWNTAYGGLFPVLSAGAEYTYNRHLDFSGGTLTLDQLEVRGGYNIPLNFSKGKTYKFLNFGSDYVFNRISPTGFYKDSFASRDRSYLRHFITWSHYLPKALQHIYPKFGWSSVFQHRHLLSDKGYQFAGNSFLYLPSFGNHSIVVNGSFQETDTNNVVFSNRFPNSRGYDEYYFSRMWKLAANYHFPIVYPDFGFASIVYFQRLRGNLFYDYTRVYSGDKSASANLRSVGGELFFDTKWWNQLPVSFGFRVSHLLDDGFAPQDKKGNNWFEFILPVNLISN